MNSKPSASKELLGSRPSGYKVSGLKRILKSILKWISFAILLALFAGIILLFVAYWRSTNDCDQLTVAQGDRMKAIVYCDYGFANLKLAEIAKPTPTDDQILVKVHAASVNPLDWHFIEGTPKIMRAMGVGLRKPKDTRLGVDFAGTVETVGKNVTQFKAGDEVFGGRDGAFAEYVCPRADRAVTLKPANITFEQAASVNIAGIDRKSTRLNSSHRCISYAVFCLKKKIHNNTKDTK